MTRIELLELEICCFCVFYVRNLEQEDEPGGLLKPLVLQITLRQTAVVNIFKKQWGVWWCRQGFEDMSDLLVWLEAQLSPCFGEKKACLCC